MEFFTLPTLTGRVLFVVIVLSHVRRRIVRFNITEHPTAEWTAQQVVEAFPDDTAPKWLHRDRDGAYSDVFRRRVAGMRIAVLTLYSRYNHRSRTHLGLGKDALDPRPVSPPSAGPIIAIPEVGGLHHRYERRAA